MPAHRLIRLEDLQILLPFFAFHRQIGDIQNTYVRLLEGIGKRLRQGMIHRRLYLDRLQAVEARFDHPAEQRLNISAGMHDHRQVVLLGKADGADMPRLDQFIVHRAGHERVILISHILKIPDPVGVALLLKQRALQLHRQFRIHRDHIQHPVRVEHHAHEQIFVTTDRMNRFKNVHPAPYKEAACILRLLPGSAVALKIDPPGIRRQPAAHSLPVRPPLYAEIDMLGSGIMQLMPPHGGPVAVQIGDGLLSFCYYLRHKIQVDHQIQRPAFLDIQHEAILKAPPVQGSRPGLFRVRPEMLIQPDPVHRFPLEYPLDAFFSGHDLAPSTDGYSH